METYWNDVHSINVNTARRWINQAKQCHNERGLARARAPHNPHLNKHETEAENMGAPNREKPQDNKQKLQPTNNRQGSMYLEISLQT
jgi:hypothetical protein